MDWVKIKSEHISSEYTDAQVGCLLRYQLLVARLGRIQTLKEISKETSIKVFSTMEQVLSKLGATSEQVASKVLEDWEQVESSKEAGKLRVRNYRAKQECNVLQEITVTEQIREDKIRVNKSREYNKEREKIPPSLEDIKQFCKEKNITVDAEKFFYHYESNGWMVGKVKMKSWTATVYKWKSNDISSQGKEIKKTKGEINEERAREHLRSRGLLCEDVQNGRSDLLLIQ